MALVSVCNKNYRGLDILFLVILLCLYKHGICYSCDILYNLYVYNLMRCSVSKHKIAWAVRFL